MENPDLAHEILVEIFSRIPTKSVGKCRTLSKSWNTHLSTSDFIKKHLTFRKQTTQQENLALTTDVGKVYIVTSPTKKDELLQIIDFSSPWLRVVGSCNGLVLLKVLKLSNPITLKRVLIQPRPLTKQHQDLVRYDRLVLHNGFILFNPITLKHVLIPPCSLTKLNQDLFCYSSVYGFGYDSCSDDYKIVQISSYSSKDDFMIKMTLVDVFSVKNGVWKRLVDDYPFREFVPNFIDRDFVKGAFLNGALHWLISRVRHRRCIAAFDLVSEVFREIPLPEGFIRQLQDDVYDVGVSVVGGCLLIVDNHGDGTTDVWILREYGVEESWAKFVIDSEEYGDRKWDAIFGTLCYVEEGELLCITSTSSKNFVFACDLKGGTMRSVVLGECDDPWFISGIAFVDSLVSPEGSL